MQQSSALPRYREPEMDTTLAQIITDLMQATQSNVRLAKEVEGLKEELARVKSTSESEPAT